MKKKLLIVFIVFIALAVVIFFNQKNEGELIRSESVNLDRVPTSTPAPTPIVIKQDSSLEEEAGKLDVEDFSKDFQSLKEEVNNF